MHGCPLETWQICWQEASRRLYTLESQKLGRRRFSRETKRRQGRRHDNPYHPSRSRQLGRNRCGRPVPFLQPPK